MFKDLAESQDFSEDLELLLNNVIEIPFTKIGYPDIKMINGHKWKKAINIDEIINETFDMYDDEGSEQSWIDILPDGVLFARPSDIEFVADFITNKALTDGLFFIDIYLYFFALVIDEARYNKIPVEKMFTQVKRNLIKEFSSMKSKSFFHAISVLG